MSNFLSTDHQNRSRALGLKPDHLQRFIIESNLIEGISRPPYNHEVDAHLTLLEHHLTPTAVKAFVQSVQPDAVLRDREGGKFNVRVGNHYPPPGGVDVKLRFEDLVGDIQNNAEHAYLLHGRYQTLHPFTDGNGRSGRALWLHQMLRFFGAEWLTIGFLHRWYYQSLEHGDSRSKDHLKPDTTRSPG